MAIGFSDGTTYKDHDEWLADSFAKVEQSTAQMKQQGNIDLNNRPKVQTEEGISTVRSASFGTDDGVVLVPTVAHDGSKILSNDEAWQQYKDSGKHLGIFQTEDQANQYADMLHKSQEDLYVKRPLEGSTEPTGALKSSGGTETPDNSEKVKSNYLKALTGTENPKPVLDILKQFAGEKWENFKNVITAPGDAWAGELDPMSTQGRERALGLAGLMVMGPAPVAAKAADGTLGSFIGVKGAKNLNVHQERGLAQILESKAESPEEILQKTGWFRGADDKWRYELDDSVAKFDENWVGTKAQKVPDQGDLIASKAPYEQIPWSPLEGKYVAKLGDVLDHPDLYKAYPSIKNLNLVYDNDMPPGALGYFDKANNAIVLSESVAGNKGVIMHEIQHMIQEEENFAKGGMALQAGKGYQLRFQQAAEEHFPDMAKFHKTIEDKLEKNIPFTDKELEKLDFYGKLSNLYTQYIKSANDKAMDLYSRLAGEVESRNTDTRLLLSKEDRRNIPPWETEDIGRSSQVVTPKVGTTTAYGVWDPDARFYRDYPKPEMRKAD